MLKYKLAVPVEFDGKTYDEIPLARPKGKHLKKIPANPNFEDIMQVACKVSGVPNKIFEEMDGFDYVKIGEQMNDFLANGPKTSGKSSE